MAGISLGSNISSLIARRRLNDASDRNSKIMERLSSGLRINKAADDAAGLAISSDLSSKARVFTRGIRNLNDGQSFLNIADAAVESLSGITVRLKELAEQSANGTFSSAQRASLDSEAQALSKEYFRISRSAIFNGINIFNGSLTGAVRFQGGYGLDGGIQSTLGGALGTGEFSSASNVVTDTVAKYDIALGDVNNDGILDLATADSNVSGGRLIVALGRTDGTFNAAVTYLGEVDGTTAVALADTNNDGFLDLISAGTDSSYDIGHVRLNQGNGTFGSAITFNTGQFSAIGDFVLADFNSDGRLDIATAAQGTDSTIVNIGGGDGTFSAPTSYTADPSVANFSIAAGDLNGDNIIDLVSAGTWSFGNGQVEVRIGRGDGTFGNAVSYLSEGTFSQSIALGDLNGDGILDVVTGGTDGAVGAVTARLGLGNGTFGTAVSYASEGTATLDVTLGDLNGDGILDLLSGGRNGGVGELTLRLGKGDGTFLAAASLQSESGGTYAVSLGDINNDGALDIVTAGTVGTGGSINTLTARTREGISPINPFSLKTKADSLQALSLFTKQQDRLSLQRGVLGAFQSRLTSTISNLQATTENLKTAESRIKDADIAEESGNLIRTQILQQAGAAILAQANQQPSIALKLLN